MNYSDIYDKRIKYKISQIKLAKYSKFKPYKISAWELGKEKPTIEELKELNKTIDKIIFEIENNNLDITKKNIHKEKTKKSKSLPKTINDCLNYKKQTENIKHTSEYSKELSELYKRMTAKKSKSAPKAIALFSGCGGLDSGFEAAGFNIVGHVEIEDSANKIYSNNFKNSKLLGKDICKITDDEINKWKEEFGNIDIIIGGPPCQGFSLAGKRNPNDERNKLYKYYAHIVSIIQPKIFVMENVNVMTSMKDSDGILFIEKIKKEFNQIGYYISINSVNAKDYGVPESRERVIIVGRKKELNNFIFPKKEEKIKTFRYATEDLESLESGDASKNDPLHWSISHPKHVIEWLKDVPEGHSAHENKNIELRPPSGFNTTYKRIMWDEPCSTISTNFNMISGSRNVHPHDTRTFTIREAARIQSFPDEFAFVGNWGDIRKAIGNAVPPILAEKIANELYIQYFNKD